MNAGFASASENERTPSEPPRLRPARFEDYGQIKQLALTHCLEAPELEDWRTAWIDNPIWPRLGKQPAIGWVLETSTSGIVGTLGTVPIAYRFGSAHLVSAAARSWVVTSAYRSFAILLLEEYLSQPNVDLFVNTTPNDMAVTLLSQFCEPIPAGKWDTMLYFVTRYRDFAKRALQNLRAPLAGSLAYPTAFALWATDILKKRLPKPTRGIDISTAERFDLRFDIFWDELVRRNPDKLLAARSTRDLSWHFGVDLRAGRIWIFTASKNGRLRAYCVFRKQYSTPNVRRIRLIDFQTLEEEADLLPGFIRAALQRCALEGYYALESIGAEVPKLQAFDAYAPHRKQLPNWRFFYGTKNAGLATQLREAQYWAPSLYDGHYE